MSQDELYTCTWDPIQFSFQWGDAQGGKLSASRTSMPELFIYVPSIANEEK